MSTCKCITSGLLRPNMTWDQLMDEIVRPEKYCSKGEGYNAPGWICSNVDHELRRADAERAIKDRYNKQKQKRNRGTAPQKQVRSTPKDIDTSVSLPKINYAV